MKPLPPKLPANTVSVTFQADGWTVVIRQNKRPHRYEGDAHRSRLLLFCVERGLVRVERPGGLTIWRNWK